MSVATDVAASIHNEALDLADLMWYYHMVQEGKFSGLRYAQAMRFPAGKPAGLCSWL